MVYKRMRWGEGVEPVDNDKLNKMIDNMDHLYENMITGYYNIFGVIRETGLTMRAASCRMTPTEGPSMTIAHTYPRPFLPGVKPVVVGSLSFDQRVRVFMGLRGFDGSAFPDHKGFYLVFNQERNPGGASEIAGTQWWSYIALGPNG